MRNTLFSLIPALVLAFPGFAQERTEITGTPESDSLEGTAGSDLISGDAGDDTLQGWEGDDLLRGDCGNDTYEFGRVIGHDVIDERCWGNRRLIDEENFANFTYDSSRDARFERDRDDLLVVLDRNNSVRINSFFARKTISALTFRDGVTRDRAEIIRSVGLSGHDAMLIDLKVEPVPGRGTDEANACPESLDFRPERRTYLCSGLFLSPSMRVTARALPGATMILSYRVLAKGSRCSDAMFNKGECTFERREQTLRNDETVVIPGMITTYGEETTNRVDAQLKVRGDRRGETTYDLGIFSRQWR